MSFVGIKKTPTDPCILRSIRPIDDQKKNPIPRTKSDLSHRQFTVCSSDSSDSESPNFHPHPPPFYGSAHARAHREELDSPQLERSSSLDKDLDIVESCDSADGLSSSSLSEDTNSAAVVRRSKSSAIQKRFRRRGVVWPDEESLRENVISKPILISHPSLRNGAKTESRLQPRSTEEQQELLRKLAESQMGASPSKFSGDNNNNQRLKQAKKTFTLERLKDNSSKSKPPITGGKMAGRIQRTIRALYEGNRRSFERLDEEASRSSDDESLDNVSMGNDRSVFEADFI